MYVKDLTDEDYEVIRNYNGTKTINEITEIFNIENKSKENIRHNLADREIAFKLERKPYPRTTRKRVKDYRHYERAKQIPGLKLEIGKRYRLVDITVNGEKPTVIKLKIIKDYGLFYLGITEGGYTETISKYPLCWEVKEIK